MEDITPEDSIVPIYLVPLTEEELAEREVLAAEAEAERLAVEEASAAKAAAKESAKAKLAALGLTEEEVTALLNQSYTLLL